MLALEVDDQLDAVSRQLHVISPCSGLQERAWRAKPWPVSRVVHDLIGGRIEPEIRERIGAIRFRATHWIDGIAVGDLIRWNPAHDVASLAIFEVLSSYVPRGLNSVYKVELGRVQPDVHVAGETYRTPSVGHLVLIEAPAVPPGSMSASGGS
jgi:hypothetical protein